MYKQPVFIDTTDNQSVMDSTLEGLKGKYGVIVNSLGYGPENNINKNKELLARFTMELVNLYGIQPGDSAETISILDLPDTDTRKSVCKHWVAGKFDPGRGCFPADSYLFIPLFFLFKMSNSTVEIGYEERSGRFYSSIQMKGNTYSGITIYTETNEEMTDVVTNNTSINPDFYRELGLDGDIELEICKGRDLGLEEENFPVVYIHEFVYFVGDFKSCWSDSLQTFPITNGKKFGVLTFDYSPDADVMYIQGNQDAELGSRSYMLSLTGEEQCPPDLVPSINALKVVESALLYDQSEFIEAYPEYAYLFPQSIGLQATKRNKIIAF